MSLEHAESVLLIDHHHSQPVELDAFLNQRMRPHGEVNLPLGDRLSNLPLLLRRASRTDQRNFEPQWTEHPLQALLVLLSENFGRRHGRHLVAIEQDNRGRGGRHRRLARSDVALK